MSKRVLAWALAATAMAATAAGCVVEVTFTPLGSQASAEGAWLINGAAANATSCSANGISAVSVVFLDGGAEFTFNQFVFDCADGSFNTGTTPVLGIGSYLAKWRYTFTDGSHADTGTFTFDVDGLTSHVVFVTGDVTSTPTFNPMGADFSVDGMWTLNGTAPTTPTCNTAGIANVRMVFFDGTVMHDYAQLTFPCADGGFDSRPDKIFAYGNYTTRWQALSSSGAVIAEGPMTPLVVASPIGHTTLQPVNFLVTPPTSLTINLTYDIDPSSTMNDTDCATAGVVNIGYALRDASTAIIGEDHRSSLVACTSSLLYEAPILSSGEYSILVEGYDSADVKMWTQTCTDLIVADGEQAVYNCALTLQASGG